MEKVVCLANVPPPLPPKTRRRVPTFLAPLIEASATVISTASNERCQSNTEDERPRQVVQSPSVSPSVERHVVKIRINPVDDALASRNIDTNAFQSKIQVVPQQFPYSSNNSCIRINVNEENMIRSDNYMKVTQDRPNPYFFYGPFPCPPAGLISSGQSSPSDTLDSGTCSDLDGSTPPPLPKKKSSSAITVTVNGNHHKRNCSLTSSGIDIDSDDDGSNISCDSLNSHELNGVIRLVDTVNIDVDESAKGGAYLDVQEDVITPVVTAPAQPPPQKIYAEQSDGESITESSLPNGLLQDIRGRATADTMLFKAKTENLSLPNRNIEIVEKALVQSEVTPSRVGSPSLVQERTYEDRRQENAIKERQHADKEKESAENKLNAKKSYVKYEEDKFYKFHLNESFAAEVPGTVKIINEVDETFAGYKDYLDNNRSTSSTIRSAKGTVRGVKNRVRAGIATFLQVHTEKNYKEREAGKVVVYTTTMGVVRATFHDCLKVKQILRTLMVRFEERDVMSREAQAEIRDRMSTDDIVLPQLFVEGQHIGNAETVERLNETGELRRILKPFKSADACTTCPVCGGYRLLPCSMCNGSKKSGHRNEFTAEFVALKCMKCDEVGLIKCYAC